MLAISTFRPPHVCRLVVGCQHLITALDADDEILASKYRVEQIRHPRIVDRWREIRKWHQMHRVELAAAMQQRLDVILPLITSLRTVIFDAFSQEPASWDPDWTYLTAKYECQDLQEIDSWRPSSLSHLCFAAVCNAFASYQVFPSQWLCTGIESHQYPTIPPISTSLSSILPSTCLAHQVLSSMRA